MLGGTIPTQSCWRANRIWLSNWTPNQSVLIRKNRLVCRGGWSLLFQKLGFPLHRPEESHSGEPFHSETVPEKMSLERTGPAITGPVITGLAITGLAITGLAITGLAIPSRSYGVTTACKALRVLRSLLGSVLLGVALLATSTWGLSRWTLGAMAQQVDPHQAGPAQAAPAREASRTNKPMKAVKSFARKPSEVLRNAKKALPAFTEEREAAALTFARRHHPDLAELLEQLRVHNQDDYRRAIRELFQTSETLANLRQRDQQRAEWGLENWQLQSQIQLLAARYQMAGDQQMAQKLQELLAQQAQLQLRRMQQEQQRLAQRLQKLNEAIEKFQTHQDQRVQRQFRLLTGDPGPSRTQSVSKQKNTSNKRP